MTPEAIGTIIGAGAAVVALLLSVLGLVFRVGTLNGTITSFMGIYERDRADMLKDIGRMEERYERHIEGHDRSKG